VIRPAFFIYLLLSLLLNSLFSTGVYAQGTGTQTVNVSVNASVADCMDFSWNMYQLLGDQDPWAGQPNQTVMDFANIYELDPRNHPRVMFTDIWYCVFLWVAANKPYHIKQEVPQPNLYNRTTNNPAHNLDDSFIVVPDYNADDKWEGLWPQGPIGKDKLGSPSLVKNANILYYGNDGKSHILRFYYSIPAQPKVSISGFKPIPTSQPAGEYKGTVTITITPQSP
jgi:hypothetical protein